MAEQLKQTSGLPQVPDPDTPPGVGEKGKEGREDRRGLVAKKGVSGSGKG